ncbi:MULTISPECIES: sugar transferase [Aquimarina]|uniref:Sugar transferase n=1 Tax=Aquimarina algiphila TaxID=2047982 RepID=A0A554VDM8_9FLAO|nr:MULTISPECIES: sugar transferase [Aquimarina]TSE05005.1 sugar transferase [Aquimarina algiphila]
MYNPYIKRVFDFFLSLSGVLLLSPFIIILVLILFVVNKGKPFFLQQRPGKNGKLFKIIKFKTMSDLKSDEKDVHNVSRITKVGAFIRKYSLDEILQLINVLKGDMSLIGPRPLLVEYLPLYNDIQKKRHNVRPGITGWAQVKGRNTISWIQKFEYDVWYVENISFMLDVKILFLTLQKVVKKEGVNVDQNTIMPAWKGNNQ